jgi:hypothetical protein
VTNARVLQIGGGLLLLAALIMGVTLGLERIFQQNQPAPVAAPAAAAQAAPVAHITATLFYATPDGQALAAVRREVPLADSPIAQGRQILSVQTEPAPEGYVSTIPSGTSVRGFYVTPQGDAFVDLSADVAKGHPGGSTAELLTVYTIVNAVTANLPSVTRVQILVDGKETDTLAGHVDLRRPLDRDTSLVSTLTAK